MTTNASRLLVTVEVQTGPDCDIPEVLAALPPAQLLAWTARPTRAGSVVVVTFTVTCDAELGAVLRGIPGWLRIAAFTDTGSHGAGVGGSATSSMPVPAAEVGAS